MNSNTLSKLWNSEAMKQAPQVRETFNLRTRRTLRTLKPHVSAMKLWNSEAMKQAPQVRETGVICIEKVYDIIEIFFFIC